MKMDILSIDIGTTSVKYVRIKGKKGSLLSFGDYPYTGSIEDLPFILQDIRIKEGTNLEVMIVVTSSEILKKTFTIPVLPKEEVKEAVRWSISKILPDPIDTYILRTGNIGPVEEKGTRKQEMYFVGAKRAFFENLLEIFESQGFKNLNLLTDASLAYLSVLKSFETERSFAILDIGGRLTGLYIFHQKRLRFVREILTAGESFTEALIGNLGLSYEEAEKYKIERGFDENESFLLSPLERLCGEVGRTINVYNQRYPEETCEVIFLTGRGSKLKGLDEKIKTFLPFRIERLVLPFPVEEEFFLSYAVATSPRLLNLLPDEFLERKKEKVFKRWIALGTALLLFILSFFTVRLFSQLKSLDLRLNLEQRILEEKRVLLQQYPKIDPSTLKEAEEILKEAEKNDSTFLFILKYLSNSIPESISLRDISFEREKGTSLFELKGFVFKGTEDAEAYLIKFLFELQRSGFMKELSIVHKEPKELYGRKAMEFVIKGQCEEAIANL